MVLDSCVTNIRISTECFGWEKQFHNFLILQVFLEYVCECDLWDCEYNINNKSSFRKKYC